MPRALPEQHRQGRVCHSLVTLLIPADSPPILVAVPVRRRLHMPRPSRRRLGGPRAAAAEHMDALSFGALRSLAENPEASPQTLALLSHDPLVDVQVAVAWNPRTPAAALRRLAEGSVEVQAGVAQNPAAAPLL